MPSWLRLPSEPEYTERGGVKEMDEYLAAKKHKEEERGKKRVEEHGWDSDDDDPPVIRREVYKCQPLESQSPPDPKNKPLPTDKPLPALPEQETEEPRIVAHWTNEIASNNPSVKYTKRDKIKAFFKFDNPFTKQKDDNDDLFSNALGNPVSTPKQPSEDQHNRREGLNALATTPATSIGTMMEAKKSKFFNFKKDGE